LRYIHPRVSIVKRARRLAPEILEILARILGVGNETPGGTTSVSSAPCASVSSAVPTSVSSAPSAPLSPLSSAIIKLLWTLELSDELLARLNAQLVPVLEQWREEALPREDPKGATPSPISPASSAAAPISYAVY